MSDRFEHDETRVIRTQAAPSAHREHVSPIYMTSSFTFDDAEHGRALFAREVSGSIYSRFTNPSVEEFVDRMCLLEDAEAGVATASGMSALFTALAGLLNQGDHVLASRSLFGSTHQILTSIFPRWGIEHTYADILNFGSWEERFRPNTRLCLVETPSNPSLDLVDLDQLGRLCAERDVVFFVDNVFATPILQKPMHFGADLVMHSATKYIDGQGRAIGGVVVGKRRFVDDIRTFARHSGPALSPFNAWTFSRSLETLSVRMDRHCRNAAALADFLFDHAEVERIKYPHHASHPQYELARRQMTMGGGVVTFIVSGGIERGRRFLDALEMCSLTANLGDVRTIATHPASTTHSSLSEDDRLAVGILPGLIRISAGLEHVEDIISDVDRALDRSR
jgi:O-succinylhomoserine sulfhydrylase